MGIIPSTPLFPLLSTSSLSNFALQDRFYTAFKDYLSCVNGDICWDYICSLQPLDWQRLCNPLCPGLNCYIRHTPEFSTWLSYWTSDLVEIFALHTRNGILFDRTEFLFHLVIFFFSTGSLSVARPSFMEDLSLEVCKMFLILQVFGQKETVAICSVTPEPVFSSFIYKSIIQLSRMWLRV